MLTISKGVSLMKIALIAHDRKKTYDGEISNSV